MHYFNFSVVVEAGKTLGALHGLVHLILHIRFLLFFYQRVQFSRGTMIGKSFQIGKNRFQHISWAQHGETHTQTLF